MSQVVAQVVLDPHDSVKDTFISSSRQGSIMNQFACLVVCLVALCFVTAFSFAEEDDVEWKQYHEQLYHSNETIGVEKTREILKNLHELYDGKTDSATLRRSERIETLLDLNDIKEEKCNDEFIAEMVELKFSKNVHPFVKHQLGLQYELCKKHAALELENAVGTLSAEHKANIETLVKNVDGGDESRYYRASKENKVVAGVLSYIDSKEGRIMDKVGGPDGNPARSWVYSLVQQSVQGLCERVVEAVKKPIQLYEKFDSTIEAEKRRDELVAQWYHTKRVCSYILFHLGDIMEDAYQGIKFTDGTARDRSLKEKLRKFIHLP